MCLAIKNSSIYDVNKVACMTHKSNLSLADQEYS